MMGEDMHHIMSIALYSLPGITPLTEVGIAFLKTLKVGSLKTMPSKTREVMDIGMR
jgi:hypothetical protein